MLQQQLQQILQKLQMRLLLLSQLQRQLNYQYTSVGTLTTLNVSGNITASSNISASGYIYGRQFEQLDSVCSTVNLNTSPIYVPLGGQSLLEQAVTTNSNVQKLAIATGKPRKVIMRNMIGGGIQFGNTGFTCSYWSAPPSIRYY
jgi:hypothetical protein